MPSFTLTAITRDPDLASRADAAGVDRIGVDVERLVKLERQGHVPNARISDHELADLARLRPSVRRAALFARLNPLHPRSGDEVEAAICGGASVLMLPFFSRASEVDRFVRLVDGRARVVLLLETAAAVVRLHDVLAVDGIGEVIVGLNDLRLSTGVADQFELVASDLMTGIAQQVRAKGLPFGFGGLGRAGDETLPIPSDLVIAQHARLGSTSAWLSRSFFSSEPPTVDLHTEVARLRARLAYWAAQPDGALAAARNRLRRHLRELVGP
jgi:hypothetical protein